MTRCQFASGRSYPARLSHVQRRNLENRLASVALLRVELELFRLDGAILRSLGEYASRELVLGNEVAGDPGVRRLATALQMERAASLSGWLQLNERALAERPWVKVVFGRPEPEDYRQPFQDIQPFDVSPYSVVVNRGQVVGELTLGKAARLLTISENTLRRRIKSLDPALAELLLRRTAGGHRRIDAKLLEILRNSGHLEQDGDS